MSSWSSLVLTWLAITVNRGLRLVRCPRCAARASLAPARPVLTACAAGPDYDRSTGVHLRTTNPIESAFATVRHRSKITKGPGSRAAGLAMAFKLIESAQDRGRAVNAPHLVALVRAGATFINGKLVERPGEDPSPKPVPCHNSHSGSEVVFSVLVRLLSGTR